MHFAVFAHQGAVGVDHDGRVVVQPGGAPLEQRRHDHHAEFPGQRAQNLAGWPRDFLREREILVVLLLAEILRGVKFWQADDFGPLAGGLADFLDRPGTVFGGGGGATHLHERETDLRGSGHEAKEMVASKPEPRTLKDESRKCPGAR